MDDTHVSPPSRSAVEQRDGGYRHRQVYLADSGEPPTGQSYHRGLLVLGLLAVLAPALMHGELETSDVEAAPPVPDTLSMRVETLAPVFTPMSMRVPKQVSLDPPTASSGADRTEHTQLRWTAAATSGSAASEGGTREAPSGAMASAEAASGASGGPRARTAARGERGHTIGVGEASYYGWSLAGNPTASGEPFDPTELTAAHRSLPFGTHVRVTNLRNGQSVVVRINDRGPFVARRLIDVSRAAAEGLGMISEGTARVRLEVLGSGMEAERGGRGGEESRRGAHRARIGW